MVNGISSADHGILAPEWFPSQSDPGFESSFVQLNAEARVTMNAQGADGYGGGPGDEKLTAGDIKVCLTVLCFSGGRNDSPGKSEVQREIVCHAPVILHEWAKHLPASAGGGSKECLIVDAKADLTHKEIR